MPNLRRVSVIPNGAGCAAARVGAARAGLVLAHLNARYTAAELGQLAAHCDAALLFFGAAQTPALEAARGMQIRFETRADGALALQRHDAEDVLPTITVPTLVAMAMILAKIASSNGHS